MSTMQYHAVQTTLTLLATENKPALTAGAVVLRYPTLASKRPCFVACNNRVATSQLPVTMCSVSCNVSNKCSAATYNLCNNALHAACHT